MTHLELVNAVLLRLREDSVSVLTSQYAKIISAFINETIREVSNAWNWLDGRDTVLVQTIEDTATYSLENVGRQFRYLSVWNKTANNYMSMVSSAVMDRFYYGSESSSSGVPTYYATNSFAANGDPLVDVYPRPDKQYDIYFNVYVPHPELVTADDVCTLPSHLIIQGAWAKAISERGEDGGQNTMEQLAMYKLALSDAISMEESLTLGETTWQPV